MKIEKLKSLILRPFLAGLIALAVGGGLFIYYYCFYENPSVASYVITAAIAVMGVLAWLSTIWFFISHLLRSKVKNNGQLVKASYVSHETHVSAAKVNYYSITYKYELDGKEYTKKSKSEFVWKEVLTLRAIKEFNIKVLNSRVVLDDDLEDLFEKNKELVKLEQQKYDEAYKQVDNLLRNS